jgi:hypothetical protein
MFAKTIIDSDAFIDMPLSTQALYFHLSMRGDDDGFINNPKKIQRMIGASDDDLKMLVAKRFIIPFDSGVVVIKHWKIHNYIRGDRKKDTMYPEEMALLEEKSNGAYSLKADGFFSVTDKCPSFDRQVTDKCQHRLGKDSLVEVSTVEDNIEPTAPKPTKYKYGYYKNVLFTDEEYRKLQEEFPHDYTERIERLSEYIASTGKKYKSHLATIRAWARKDTVQRPANRKGGNVFLEIAQEEGIV